MKFKSEYDNLKSDYEDFLKEFIRGTEKILHREKIPIAFSIYGRLKSYDSIEEKIDSKRFSIEKSITELNDLIGIRIVLLFPEYKEKVIDILKNEFVPLNEIKKEIEIPDKFGYSSAHLILKIKEEWLRTPYWENHSDKKIEVQIRTLSEHIWAETSHILFYKKEENIPKIITRDLYKLSAILEVVDDKLKEIKDKVDEHFKYISDAPYEDILNLDLNSETFRRVMKENSKGIYENNDYKNKVLSSKIEKEYDLHNVRAFDEIIKEKINLSNLKSEDYINAVIELLESKS